MRPVVLCILDGWGLSPYREANAVALGHTPNFDRIWATCPHAQLAAHGPDVGLPEGQMGNSEVGHMNIGAGRIVWMDLPRIDNAIADGSFATNPALLAFIAALHASGGTAHLAGLASPGGVHAHQRQIAAAAGVIAAAGIPVAIHAYLDGRDVPPQSAEAQVAALEAALPPGARIATVSGRFYAMDRDSRWERVALAVAAMLRGEGLRADTAADAIAAAYARGETDEFVVPTVIGGYAGARDGDGLFFANFRADRARQILGALVDPAFDGFDVGPRPQWAALLGMVQYSDHLDHLMPAMFPSDNIVNTLGSWVAARGLKQFRTAETEKYPHVTFFLNGGVEVPASGEARYMAQSPKVRTYDLQPEMSEPEVAEHLVAAIRSGEYALVVVNFANPDMVGHTGILAAAIKAVEAVDRGLGDVLAAVEDMGGAIIVTADHGNCEVMVDPDHRRAPHRPHPEPGAGDPRRRPGGRHPAQRTPGRPRADAPRPDGHRPAARDERTEPDRPVMVRRLLLVLLCGWAPPALAAADAADAIGAATARVTEAGAGLAGAEAEPVNLARLADAVSAYEAAVAALAAGVAQADGRTLALRDGFAARRTEIMRLLAALEAISRSPVPQRGIHPDGPLGAARAAAMVDRLEPALRSEATALAGEVAALRAAEDVQAGGETALAAAEARLAAARSALAAALAAAVPPAEGPEVSALTRMARDSESLTALATALARADGPAPPASADAGPLLLAGGRCGGAALRRARRRRRAPTRHRPRRPGARDRQGAGRRGGPLRRPLPRIRLRDRARARGRHDGGARGPRAAPDRAPAPPSGAAICSA